MKLIKLYNSILIPFLLVFLSAALICHKVEAVESSYQKNFTVEHSVSGVKVNREDILKKFLQKYNSPLLSNVKTFLAVADKYGIDYRLLPAISCMESTCGKNIIPGSYNAWGWGIYANNVIVFENFDEGIETVGRGLYENYIKQGLDTPSKIAPIYTPPMSNHWLNGVTYFMNQMDAISYQQG